MDDMLASHHPAGDKVRCSGVEWSRARMDEGVWQADTQQRLTDMIVNCDDSSGHCGRAIGSGSVHLIS